MRKFKIEGISFEVVDKPYTGMENRGKYDILWFNEMQGGWNRLTSANTLAEAKEKARDRVWEGKIEIQY
ncbi:hypothetical protein [Romboutsia sp.]|uniref:hypothetical protein n=1 Tax=Romboutsia sp. TaxID=1965302 RepID=UPI002C7BF8D2|nr:hypothetical protein [Romboutsia sp.]HSQ90312.1 hypothetical protein [Romboutsia sp.]